MQFVSYHVDGNGVDSVPISTGTSVDEARGVAIKRILGLCILDGTIHTQERGDLSADDFSALAAHLDTYFAEKLPVLN